MELTYVIIVAFFTYLFAEITKVFKINSKWIPLVNLGIGILSAVVSLVFGILPAETPLDYLSGAITCIISALGAGGFYDLVSMKKDGK